MSNEMLCGDPAALAGFVYDECEAGEREEMLVHLALCEACSGEVAALRATRGQIARWAPPAIELGFRVTEDDAATASDLQPSAVRGGQWWRWSAMPAWAQAAAAVLLFACGAATAAVTNIEVRRDESGLTVRTGWIQSAPAVAPVTADAAVEAQVREEVRRAYAELEGSMQVAPTTASQPAAVQPDDVLRQVRTLVAESEQRQQQELAFRVSQAVREMDLQRRADIDRIERTVGPMEGVTTKELQEQRRMLNYLITVSQTN